MRAGIYWVHEGVGFAMTQAAAAAQDRRAAGQVEHPALRQGPRAAPQADPELPGRLQANPQLRHLLPGHRRPEDRGDHRRASRGSRPTASSPPTASSARSTSWCSPPASTSPTPTPTSTSRARAARTWSTAGTARASRRTAASPSPTCRTCSSCSGPNTALGHNSVVFMIESQIRYVAQAIAAVDKAARRRRWRRPAPRRTIQRRTAARPGQHGVEHRRLPELVPRRARREPHPVERHDLAVLAGDPPFQDRRSTTFSGSELSRRHDTPTQVVVLRRVVGPQL